MDSFFDQEKGGGEYQNTLARAGLLLRQPWVALLAGGGLVLRASVRRNFPLALIGGAVLYRGATGRWPLAGLLGLPTNEKRHPATSVPHESGIKVERSIRIGKSPDDLYRFWRNLENLPRFMSQHVEIRRLDDKRSHWKLQSLAGATFEWDAEIINDLPNELLAWRSLDNADIDHAGSVHFEGDGAGGSTVTVIMEYRPPAGRIGAEIARLFGQEPAQVLEKDLQRFKQLMESGEIGPGEGQTYGARI
jgi:uncharacterized membrane protein